MRTHRRLALVHACGVATCLGNAAAQVDPDPGRNATCAQPSTFGTDVFANTIPNWAVSDRADAELAVGPCHVVAIANVGIKTYHKPGPAGTLDSRLSREDFSHSLPAFWAPVAAQPVFSTAFDPQASYDALSGRFWTSAILVERTTPAFPFVPETWYFSLAVSKGSDPNPSGSEPAWWFFYVDMTSIVEGPSFIDRPTLSIDDDRVYINGIGTSSGRVVVLDKSPLLNGSSPAVFAPVEEQVVDLTS